MSDSSFTQEMDNLDPDNLRRLQIEQVEKEKKEISERMRILSKRLDHVERAYRKEERPLLAKDYEVQQANDRAVFETSQKARLEAHRQAHVQDIETKKRLSRMLNDVNQIKETISARRGEEFAKKKESAQRKMEEEKAKRRAAILKEREEARLRAEEEERIEREREEEEARQEAGMSTNSSLVVLSSHHNPQSALQRRDARQRKKKKLVRLSNRRNWRRRSVSRLSARREKKNVNAL